VRAVVIFLVLAACQREHAVGLELGPSEGTLSIGFRCREQADPTKLLIQRAPLRNGRISITIVVDLIDLGGRVLGCRGEELLAACDPTTGGTCGVTVAANPVRYCKEIEVPVGNGDPMTVADNFLERARGAVITTDAPSYPVVVRAVATTESCATIQQSSDGVDYDPLDPDLAVGCAYSCPVQLDEIDGSIYLSLDALTEICEPAVRHCAGGL
jgi:hypothetical protein